MLTSVAETAELGRPRAVGAAGALTGRAEPPLHGMPRHDPARQVVGGRGLGLQRRHCRRGCADVSDVKPQRFWHDGQKYVDRWPITTRRMGVPQRGQGWPSRP